MRPIVTDVTRSVVCMSVLVTRMCPAKWLDRSRCRVWGGALIHFGPKSHILDGDQDRTDPYLLPREVTSQRCGLLPNYFGHVL